MVEKRRATRKHFEASVEKREPREHFSASAYGLSFENLSLGSLFLAQASFASRAPRREYLEGWIGRQLEEVF